MRLNKLPSPGEISRNCQLKTSFVWQTKENHGKYFDEEDFVITDQKNFEKNKKEDQCSTTGRLMRVLDITMQNECTTQHLNVNSYYQQGSCL